MLVMKAKYVCVIFLLVLGFYGGYSINYIQAQSMPEIPPQMMPSPLAPPPGMEMFGESYEDDVPLLPVYSRETDVAGMPEKSPAPPRRASAALGRQAAYDSIFHAIAAQDLYACVDFIRNGADLSARNQDNLDPLLYAAQQGCANIVEELARAGVDPMAKDPQGRMAAHLAAMANRVYTLLELHVRGFSFDVPDQRNYLPSHTAAEKGNADAIRMLAALNENITSGVEHGVHSGPAIVAAMAKQWDVVSLLRALNVGYGLHQAVRLGDFEYVREIIKAAPGSVNAKTLSGGTPLMAATMAKDLDMIKLLLEAGADPLAEDNDYRTAISLGVSIKFKEGIDLLLEHGADINMVTQTFSGDSMLHQAIPSAEAEMIDFLISRGAAIDAVNKSGMTPLHVAVENNRLDVVRLLVNKGASIENKNQDAFSPLHLAVEKGFLDIAVFFLDQGADIKTKDRRRFTPLHSAVMLGNAEMVKLLIERSADIAFKDKEGRTPLHLAAETGNMNIAQQLVDKGSDIEAVDREKRTPLFYSIMNDHSAVMDYLLSKGANFEARDSDERTPIITALYHQRLNIARKLAEIGADTNIIDRFGRTALFASSENDTPEMTQWLVSLNMDLNARDNTDWTPLHAAAERGCMETVEWLVQKGAEVNAQDKQGRTPLHVASRRGHIMIVKALTSGGADIRAADNEGRLPLHVSAAAGHWGPVQLFILRGLNIDMPDGGGNTPLHAAVMNGHLRTVKLLVGKRADTCALNKSGQTPLELVLEQVKNRPPALGLTPLQLAMRIGQDRTVMFLRAVIYQELIDAARFGDVERLDTVLTLNPDYANGMLFGRTPLHLAAYEGQQAAVECLLKHGADANLTSETTEGFTPLHEAAQRGHANVLRVLLAHGASKTQKSFSGQTPAEVARNSGQPNAAVVIDSVVQK